MLMASLQKYFGWGLWETLCGIPGVEMVGIEDDWKMLVEKTRRLEAMLQPLMGSLGLGRWFTTSLATLEKLLATFREEPEKEWWGHMLSWNVMNMSGQRSHWSGWMIDFPMAGRAEGPQDFQSGLVSVPVTITDCQSVMLMT